MSASSSFWAFDLSGRMPELDTSTVVGITVAICGNILISLALNLQKLAHKRLDEEKSSPWNSKRPSSGPSLNERDEEDLETSDDEISTETVTLATRRRASQSEPLLPTQTVVYGAVETQSPRRTLVSFVAAPFRKKTRSIHVDPPNASNSRNRPPEVKQDQGNESDYLRSKMWWIGFLLMNVGELGNFISYAWAPASVVAPLGTFALIANCFFAPLLIKEQFRKRDLVGILIAIVGAITVVLSSNTSDTRLDADGLLQAISQTPFLIYSSVYVIGAICLSILSDGPLGQRYVYVDVGLCALFGGFTVLSTKAVSTLLTMQWIKIFTHPITYPVLLVLALTGVGQIRYLNRALMKFDSKIVIPTQFVLFNLSAILGSAILYGDFQKATFHSMVTFLYGCAATFAGVFVISSSSPSESSSESTPEEDGENAEHRPGAGEESERRRPALVLTPNLNIRHRQSAVSLMGLSNAHHLLLVHTPPRETPPAFWEQGHGSPDSYRRNRATSWFGEASRDVLPRERSVTRTRPRSRTTMSMDGTAPSTG